MSVLVVAAHPDDEVLGCGGTLLQYVDISIPVHVLVMADGVSSRLSGKVETLEYFAMVRKRRLSFESVCKSAGFVPRWVGRREDNCMDTLPLLRIVKWVEDYVDEVKPTTIFTHYEHDLNIDHRIAYQAVVTACRPFKYPHVKGIYSFEVPSSTELASVPFKPDTFVDITRTRDRKVELFHIYGEESQARNASTIYDFAAYRGNQGGCDYAEAFKTVRRCGIIVP